METPVGRILVLPSTILTHWKRRHRRPLPIVRRTGEDRESRPAGRTSNERISEASVAGVEKFSETCVARRQIGRHTHIRFGGASTGIADFDPEGSITSNRERCGYATINRGMSGRLCDQFRFKLFELRWLSLDFDEDAVRGVSNKPRERQARGKTVDERAKTNALDNPANSNTSPLHAGVAESRHVRTSTLARMIAPP